MSTKNLEGLKSYIAADNAKGTSDRPAAAGYAVELAFRSIEESLGHFAARHGPVAEDFVDLLERLRVDLGLGTRTAAGRRELRACLREGRPFDLEKMR